MQNENRLFVVSGPSGVGKDTVVSLIRASHPEIEKTISATTRTPRAYEKDGVDYYFHTLEEFQKLQAEDCVLEYNFYNGNYYGTLRSEVDRRLAEGKPVVLVIDVNGAANVKRLYPGSTTIFVCPPSMEELEARLKGRGTDSAESLAGRLARAREEMALAPTYDFRVVNTDKDQCAAEIYALIQTRSAAAD